MSVSDPAGHAPTPAGRSRHRSETLTFLFLTIFLAPFLAVAFVGGYGFLIWIYQIFTGPPGS
ncbi:periplasmic nitrate reductase, NapE protein [Dongia sp.]|uniref:periplasmic nitrate reductase, NapE protein n=1 Tax=Dongia sp. TaxID=1977262 RepID=UPI0035B15604